MGCCISFGTLVGLLIFNQAKVTNNMGEEITQLVQKEVEQKIKLATDSMALSLGVLVKGLPEKEQIEIIAKAIEDFRFEEDKSGYYFVYQEYVPVAHPTRKDLIGKSLYEAKDANGVYYVRDLYSTAQSQTPKGKFVYFVFSKPLPDGTLTTADKVGYAAMIPNTRNMWISTGVYVDTLAEYAQPISDRIIDLIRDFLLKSFSAATIVFIIVFVPLVIGFYSNLLRSVRILQKTFLCFLPT